MKNLKTLFIFLLIFTAIFLTGCKKKVEEEFFTQDMIYEIAEQEGWGYICEIIEKEAISDPDSVAEYSNPNKGISIMLPYNDKWKVLGATVPTFEEDEDTVYYGRYRDYAAICGYGRQFFQFEEPVAVNELLEDFNKKEYKYIEPLLKTINGLEVVEYADGEFCNGVWGAVVVTENYNINFPDVCGNQNSLI
ncbi:hypothetical protein KJ742_01835, partial [Patescibacteria group bacterium]|nr:hypothetical protein [Patescibacteria group bacterium]